MHIQTTLQQVLNQTGNIKAKNCGIVCGFYSFCLDNIKQANAIPEIIREYEKVCLPCLQTKILLNIFSTGRICIDQHYC